MGAMRRGGMEQVKERKANTNERIKRLNVDSMYG
jgi:hypothetical protein